MLGSSEGRGAAKSAFGVLFVFITKKKGPCARHAAVDGPGTDDIQYQVATTLSGEREEELHTHGRRNGLSRRKFLCDCGAVHTGASIDSRAAEEEYVVQCL